MKLKFLSAILFLSCLACSHAKEEKSDTPESGTRTDIEFDKTKWRIKEVNDFNQPDYPHRNEMLKDLINHQRLNGLKKNELLDLLGQPDQIDSGYLFYQVSQRRLYFFPLHTKTLVIKLDRDSTVEWRKIHGN
jgi:hypothetical protein